jgi:predicted DCC family thiol-disulfide oxidoreductase YuxK
VNGGPGLRAPGRLVEGVAQPINTFPKRAKSGMGTGRHLLYFDGTCGLCDGVVQFVLRHDATARFRFSPLQGQVAREALARFGADAAALQTVYVLADADTPAERLLGGSDAVLFVLAQLPAPWRWLSGLRRLPRGLRDGVYGLVARHRYRVFGRREACRVPSPAERARFL